MANSCPNHNQITTAQPGKIQATFDHRLCCKCGIPTSPDEANMFRDEINMCRKVNMCRKCLILELDITKGLPSHLNLLHCPDCFSYFQPPSTWLKVQRDEDLLSICLKKLKLPSALQLVDAKLLPTQPWDMTISVSLRVQKEVLHMPQFQKSYTVRYNVKHLECLSCAEASRWEAVVKLRQNVPHLRNFLFSRQLQQLIYRHTTVERAVDLKLQRRGIDIFFAKKRDAVKFFEFICELVPVMHNKSLKECLSQDTKSGMSCSKLSIPVVISPVIHEDLIYLSPRISESLGWFGPLVICMEVTNTITLLDPFTLQELVLSADQYWRAPFQPLLSRHKLVEYLVLEVQVISSEVDNIHPIYTSAKVSIARVSHFGKNEATFSLKTHLGHLLKPGDYAFGYELHGLLNLTDGQLEQHEAPLPDAVLIKKG